MTTFYCTDTFYQFEVCGLSGQGPHQVEYCPYCGERVERADD